MTKTVIAAICLLLLVALPGCEALRSDCEHVGDRWCDGRDLMACESDDEDTDDSGGFLEFSSQSAVVSETCAPTQVCVDWTEAHGARDAACVERSACGMQDAFCIDNDVAATCVEGQDVPEVNACGDESFEGGWCNVSSSDAAVCAFDDLPCAPEGARKCLGSGSRYAMVCADGEWSALDPCLVGESCYDLSGGGIACRLRMWGWQ